MRLSVALLLSTCATGVHAQASLILDIVPGAGGSGITESTVMNDVLYARTSTPELGTELWRTDGTAAGTYMVKDIQPGPGSSTPAGLVTVDGVLYFTANDGVHGPELWSSDGTEAGTTLVKDIIPGVVGGGGLHLTAFNGLVIFAANTADTGNELWRTDGTDAGTYLVRDIWPGADGSVPNELVAMGDAVYFAADDGVNGRELWRTDGTEAGTVMVKEIAPDSADNNLNYSTVIGGVLFFSAYDPVHGNELWRSDGTEAGTVLVKDIFAGPYSGAPMEIVDLNGMAVFHAYAEANGREVWRSDGTEAGTMMIADLRPGTVSGVQAAQLWTVNGRVFFNADDGSGNYGMELYSTDGADVALLKDVHPGPVGIIPTVGLPACDGFVFRADDGVHGTELWRSDGTEAGTVLAADIVPGAGSSVPRPLAMLNGDVLLTATTPDNGSEPWRYACGFVGVDEVSPAGVPWLGPNPVNALLRMELPDGSGAWTIHIRDAGGRLVHQTTSTGGTHVVDVRGWSQGLYHVLAESGTLRNEGRVMVVP